MRRQAPVTGALTGLDALATDPRADRPSTASPWPVPTVPLLRMVARLAARPLVVGRRGADLAAELVAVGLGRSDRSVDLPDPVLRRLVQAHLAGREAAAGLVADAGLDRSDRDRIDAVLGTVLTAVDDVLSALVPGAQPDRPEPVAPGRALRVGRDVAATPGAVVLRTPVFELIQYLPRTETVRAVPLLVVPPLANRHYLTDLAPGRSIVEHLVAGGLQVLALAWHNPGPEHADRGLDTYARAVLDAMDACERITRAPSTGLMAAGSGGTVTAAALGHLAAVGVAERAASLTLALPALVRPDPDTVRAAPADPPAELAFWAADTLRVPARLHAELIDIAARDALAHAGSVRVLGSSVDLSKIDLDAYLVTGDRGRWWPGYRGARLLGGESRFVLGEGGPVEAVTGPRAFIAGPATEADPDRWHAAAERITGSWWTDHRDWLAERSGPSVDAPPELGGRGLHAITPTPGDYVRSR